MWNMQILKCICNQSSHTLSHLYKWHTPKIITKKVYTHYLLGIWDSTYNEHDLLFSGASSKITEEFLRYTIISIIFQLERQGKKRNKMIIEIKKRNVNLMYFQVNEKGTYEVTLRHPIIQTTGYTYCWRIPLLHKVCFCKLFLY